LHLEATKAIAPPRTLNGNLRCNSLRDKELRNVKELSTMATSHIDRSLLNLDGCVRASGYTQTATIAPMNSSEASWKPLLIRNSFTDRFS
jgi:hypothetical protein